MKGVLTLKKFFIPFFVCMLSSFFIGCSSSEETSLLDPSNPITIDFWHYYNGSVSQEMDILIDDFNDTIGKEYGVIVRGTSKGSIVKLEDAIMLASDNVIYSESLPHLFLSYADSTLELSHLDLICDLDDYFTTTELNQLLPAFLESGIINNQRLILPFVKSTEVFYLNDTIWQPFSQAYQYTYDDLQTFDSIFQIAQQYYQHTDDLTPDIPNDGRAFFGIDSPLNFITIVHKQFGIDLFDQTADTFIINESIMRQLFDFYVTGFSLGYFEMEGAFRSDDVRSGQIMSYVGSSASGTYFPDWIEEDNQKLDIDCMVLPYPTFTEGSPAVLSQGAGICMSRSSPAEEYGSYLFLKYLISADINIDFALETNYIPIISYFLATEDFSQNLTEIISEKTQDDEKLYGKKIAIYETVAHQIQDDILYETFAFENSYYIRNILLTEFLKVAEQTRVETDVLFANGLSHEEVLAQFNFDAKFQSMLNGMSQSFETQQIPYQ